MCSMADRRRTLGKLLLPISTSEVRSPVVHEPAPALEQVRTPIGCLDSVLDDVRQGCLDDLAGMIRLLGRPIPEARAKTVRHGRDPVFLEHPAQLLLLELLADPIRKQERTGSLHERPCLVKNLHGPTTQRHPVLPVRLHPLSRYGPHAILPIDLGPLGPAYLAAIGTRNSKASVTTGAAHDDRTVLTSGRSYLAVGQRLHVLHQVLVGTEPRRETVARVVGPKPHPRRTRMNGHQHGFDAVARLPACDRTCEAPRRAAAMYRHGPSRRRQAIANRSPLR